jgi:hypothetical protein
MELIPDEVRVVDIFGAQYFIPWEEVTVGSSFFLPTTATAKQVRESLAPAAAYFQARFETRARREFGLYGVRVWRVL